MCYNGYTAGSNSTKGAEIMDDKKIAYQDEQANANAQSPYLEEFVYLLSLLTPEAKNKLSDYAKTLQDNAQNQAVASDFPKVKN